MARSGGRKAKKRDLAKNGESHSLKFLCVRHRDGGVHSTVYASSISARTALDTYINTARSLGYRIELASSARDASHWVALKSDTVVTFWISPQMKRLLMNASVLLRWRVRRESTVTW